MKNLKRVLSLALVGTMLSGMMVMGASATSYTDDEKIVHQEAVDVMSALNIINGKPDGNYDPEGFVTRAEMAKMIAVAMNGGKDTTYGIKTTASYTDIKGHWAEQYIEYCSDLKIINGRGDGTFDPEGKVTGVEAAKMLLTALGYDSVAFQFTGADWDTNVNYEATQTAEPKLYEELDGVVVAQPITRDSAAQVIWNALQNQTMTKTPDKAISTGEVTYTYEPSGKTMLKAQYDADIFVGTFDGNDKFSSAGSPRKGEIAVSGRLDSEAILKADGKTENSRTVTFPYDFDIANIGDEVKVIFKDGKGGTKKDPDKQDKIYGVFLTGAGNTVTSTVDKVAGLESAKAQIKVDGTLYDVDEEKGVTVYRNFVEKTKKSFTKASELEGADDATSKLTDYLRKTSDTEGKPGNNGNIVKLVLNANDEVKTVYITESKLAVVTAENSTKVTLNNGVGTVKLEDNDVYEDIEKDDVVVATTYYAEKANDDDAYTVIVPAEKISGELRVYKYKYTANTGKEVDECISVKMDDGETYKIVDKTKKMLVDNLEDAIEQFEEDIHIGEQFDLYLVNGYVGAAVQTTESNSNYSVIIETSDENTVIGNAIDGAKIRVMGADGTKTVLTLSDKCKKVDPDTGKKVDVEKITEFTEGSIVTYSVNKNGEADVTIEDTLNTKPSEKVSYLKSTKTVRITGDEIKDYKVGNDCVLYVNTAEAGAVKEIYKAYTLRSLKDINVKDAKTLDYSVVLNSRDEVVALYLNLNAKPGGATSSRVYGIVSDFTGRSKTDSEYYEYTVDVNDDKYTILYNSRVTVGAIVTFEPTADNVYDVSDIQVLKDGETVDGSDKIFFGYISDYSTKDNTITVVNKLAEVKDEDGELDHWKVDDNADETIYALSDDCVIYGVDADAQDGSSAGLSTFDTIEGKKNVIVIINNGDEVTAVIVETSSKKDIDNKNK